VSLGLGSVSRLQENLQIVELSIVKHFEEDLPSCSFLDGEVSPRHDVALGFLPQAHVQGIRIDCPGLKTVHIAGEGTVRA